MLPDLERKLHRILVNFPGPHNRHQMPDFKLLEIKTGRKRQEILKGLNSLEDSGLIVWPDKSTTQGIGVIHHDLDFAPKPKTHRNNTAYWTQY